jgi:hypothetical protein
MDELTQGPINDDGLPAWIEWRGARYATPNFETLQVWVFDSVCEALDGSTIEPDGTTFDGCPSWLLALGLV